MRIFLLAGFLFISARCSAQCTPEWANWFATGDVHGAVHAFAKVDSKLYAAGTFTSVGSEVARRVAVWDGQSWAAIGGGLADGMGVTTGRCIALFDEDAGGPTPPALFVGGSFATAGGVPASAIARWDGTQWSSVGEEFSTAGTNLVLSVHTLAEFDEDGPGPGTPALFAGGSFVTIGGASIAGLARWNGQQWSVVGSGLALAGGIPRVYALAVIDPDDDGPALPALYAGGTFDAAGGVSASNIARWDGAQWFALGSGVGGAFGPAVRAIVRHDPDGAGPLPPLVFAGGQFDRAGASAATNVAAWDGVDWTPKGLVNSVLTLQVFDPGSGPKLYAGSAPNGLTSWTGTAWVALPNAPSVSTRALFAAQSGTGGPTHLLVGTDATASQWDGVTWSRIAGPDRGIMGEVRALASWDEDGPGIGPRRLYVGGSFGLAATVSASNIASWDGTVWQPLGTGLSGQLSRTDALCEFDEDGQGPLSPALFAGGKFTSAGGVTCQGIARWDGSAWSKVGSGIFGSIGSLAVWDADGPGPASPALYAGGFASLTSPASDGGVLRWDGTAWARLGQPLDSGVSALVVFDEDGTGPVQPTLFAGGGFSLSGGKAIAKWTGASWAAVGGGMQAATSIAEVRALAVFDEDGTGPNPPRLFAGGWFTSAGGSPINGVARWNGLNWSDVGGLQNSSNAGAMLAYDEDGPGPAPQALYAGGALFYQGSSGVSFAKWDGVAWTPVPLGGVANKALGLYDDGKGPSAALYAGGGAGIGRWGCLFPATCYPNCDASTAIPVLNVNDFTCFLNKYAAGDPYANCDNSTSAPTLNVNDFTCFLNLYAAGCT